MANDFNNEVDLARIVCEWLEHWGWDVYQEVPMFKSGGDCDIVATQGKLVWAIECKLVLGEGVCKQALSRLGEAHLVSVAVPGTKGFRDRVVVEYFLKNHGIGLLEVNDYKSYEYAYGITDALRCACREAIKARFFRFPDERLDRIAKNIRRTKSYLTPDWKNTVAGLPGGGQMTLWKRTMISVEKFLRENGPHTLVEIIRKVDHHYGKDRQAKAGLMRAFTEIGVSKHKFECVQENGVIKWKVKETV